MKLTSFKKRVANENGSKAQILDAAMDKAGTYLAGRPRNYYLECAGLYSGTPWGRYESVATAYARPSRYKIEIERDIISWGESVARHIGGIMRNYSIESKSAHFFTCGYDIFMGDEKIAHIHHTSTRIDIAIY